MNYLLFTSQNMDDSANAILYSGDIENELETTSKNVKHSENSWKTCAMIYQLAVRTQPIYFFQRR